MNGRAGAELASLDSSLDAGFSRLGLLSCVREESIQQYLLKMVRQTLFRTVMVRQGPQWGREVGFKSKYSANKWECIAKEQGREGQWRENYPEVTLGVRGFWLN